MNTDIGVENLVDDYRANHKPDHDTEDEYVANARTQGPVILLFLHETRARQDTDIVRKPFLERCAHVLRVGARFETNQPHLDHVLRMAWKHPEKVQIARDQRPVDAE